MIAISAKDINKSFGSKEILNNISFHINFKDCVGLVGPNGAGKTTLLNVLFSPLEKDSGDIYISNNTTLGYFRQSDSFYSEKTIWDEMLDIFSEVAGIEKRMNVMSHEIARISENGGETTALLHEYDDLTEEFKRKRGYTYQSEISSMLYIMGFGSDEIQKNISVLSGGEKTRLSLCAALLSRPDLLFLDEPTNHLDIDTMNWLEQYINSYDGTVIIVSHDRYFLDKVTNKIFEIENHGISVFGGNYSSYIEKKKQQEKDHLKKYTIQQQEIKRQEEMIRKFRQHATEKLAKRAQSREKALEALERVDKPMPIMKSIKFHFKEGIKSGKDVMHVENVSKSFGEKHLFSEASFDIKRDEKVCLIGPNGVGKTTLLKILIEKATPDSGFVKAGFHVIFGYYDQERKLLNPQNTVINEVHSDYRLYTEPELRNILGRFLFKGNDVNKKVAVLSGGEKARLSLLKLILSGANFLIMDEPTNHLDIQSKEVFEDAIMEFPGTVLMVSHDRYFLNKVPSRTLELTQNGVRQYLGNYDYYLSKRESESITNSECLDISQIENENMTDAKNQFIEQKEVLKKKRKKKRQFEKVEEEIHICEEKMKALQDEMAKKAVFSDHKLLNELSVDQNLLKEKLESLYLQWEDLSHEMSE